jgi:hypothetical protein
VALQSHLVALQSCIALLISLEALQSLFFTKEVRLEALQSRQMFKYSETTR